MPSPTGRLTNSNPSIEIMSAQQKVKECSTCAQGFNEDNNEVGVRIGSGCADEHKGPFVRILIATAPAAATAAPEIIGLMIAALDERDKKKQRNKRSHISSLDCNGPKIVPESWICHYGC